MIGRVYTVHPADVERFCLRILLHHVCGATCYADLRTHDGAVYSTFREAAVARGLLEDDHEWDCCLSEAATVGSAQ